MRFALLVNPASGGGRAAAEGVAVARLLREAGAEVTLEHTTSAAAGRAAAAAAVGSGTTVVAVGGDGMVRSVAGAVVAGDGLLGIVPGGRGNDFARQLGLPLEPDAVAAALLGGGERRVDVIEATGPALGAPEVVLGSVYVGVDSLTSAFVDRSHALPRSVQYPAAAVRGLIASRARTYRVEVNGAASTHVAHSVVVANSGYYGSGMHIAPDAAVDDGLLDVVVIGAAHKVRLLRAMPRLYSGSHVELPEVVVLRGARVSLAWDGPAGPDAYADGDHLAVLPLTASVRPRALRIAVPG